MKRLDRRNFLQKAALASAGVSILNSKMEKNLLAAASVSQNNLYVYYYDNIIPSEVSKYGDWLESSGFRGFIFPGGEAGSDTNQIDTYVAPAEKLAKRGFQTFFRIQICNIPKEYGNRAVDWRNDVVTYVTTFANKCRNRGIPGLCFDTEGDAFQSDKVTEPDAEKWGTDLTQKFLEVFPSGILLIMHCGPYDVVDIVPKTLTIRWYAFLRGVLKTLYPYTYSQLCLLSESTYTAQAKKNNDEVFKGIQDTFSGICKGLSGVFSKNDNASKMWNNTARTRIHLGLWPLGVGEDKDKNIARNKRQEKMWVAADYTDQEDDFGACIEGVKRAEYRPSSGDARKAFLWIYGQDTAWMPQGGTSCTYKKRPTSPPYYSTAPATINAPTSSSLGGNMNIAFPVDTIECYRKKLRSVCPRVTVLKGK